MPLRSIPSLLIVLALASCEEGPVEPEPFEGEPSEELLYSDFGGLFLLNVATGDVTQVTNSDEIGAGSAVWSPDGERIAFSGGHVPEDGQPGNRADLFVMDADGGNLRRITETVFDEVRPAWSPDGTRLAYERWDGVGIDLMVVDVDGGSPTELVTGMALYLAWSPDGQSIAFIGGCTSEAPCRQGETSSEIYVIEADGTGLRRLTNDVFQVQDLQWSPAGDRLVYTEFPAAGGDTELFTIRPDGTNRRRITNNSSTDFNPRWSPDGRRIAFATFRNDGPRIHVINAEGGNEIVLESPESVYETGAAWNPDGKRIAFTGCFNALGCGGVGPYHTNLFVIDSDGTNLEQLTHTSSIKGLIGWRP